MLFGIFEKALKALQIKAFYFIYLFCVIISHKFINSAYENILTFCYYQFSNKIDCMNSGNE